MQNKMMNENLFRKMDSRLPSLLEASPNLENVVSLRLEDTPKNRKHFKIFI